MNEKGGAKRAASSPRGEGLGREALESEEMVLPGTRFAVDAYVNFVATRPWIEGVASSLTELFAPDLMTRRLAAFEQHYTWINPETLEYFRSRPPLATRDSDHGLSLVQEHCQSREQQQRAVDALRFKCDLLWAQLDVLYQNSVDPTRKDEDDVS